MGFWNALTGANRAEAATKAVKATQDALDVAKANLETVSASGKKGKKARELLEAAKTGKDEAKKARNAARETAESFKETTRARKKLGGGIVATAAGTGVTYGAYKIGEHNGQAEPPPATPEERLKNGYKELTDPADGSPPILGIGSLIGAGLLGGAALYLGQGVLAIVLAVVGAFGGQAIMNAISSHTSSAPEPAAGTTPGGRSAAEPEANPNINAQARSNAAGRRQPGNDVEGVIASVDTESLGGLSTQPLLPASGLAAKDQKKNPLKPDQQNAIG